VAIGYGQYPEVFKSYFSGLNFNKSGDSVPEQQQQTKKAEDDTVYPVWFGLG